MNAAKLRVCVGMSGGVDSSVAAYLMKQQGYEVFGVTFRNWPQDCLSRAEDKCCGPQAVTDARMVAHKIGIPHYVADEIGAFQRDVIDYFVAEYRRGRTPNPCVVCNNKIKFGTMLEKARSLGAEAVATGHYARIVATADGRHELRRGGDAAKDQSYFLFGLTQAQLAHAHMPVGELSKDQTRAIARELGLKTHDKVESQEICFVPGQDYGRFLRDAAHLPDRPGEVVSEEGKVIGTHQGIQYFTIGQREGLGIGGQKEPLYVVGLDPVSNRVTAGPRAALMRDEFAVSHCNWLGLAAPPMEPVECLVKIRYNHRGCLARVMPAAGHLWRVELAEAQRAIAPGQAAVFYRGDLVLGGGWIC